MRIVSMGDEWTALLIEEEDIPLLKAGRIIMSDRHVVEIGVDRSPGWHRSDKAIMRFNNLLELPTEEPGCVPGSASEDPNHG